MTLLRAFPVIIWLQSFTHSTVLNELTVYNATSHHIKSGIPLTATFGTAHPLTANVPYCCVTVRALRFNVPIKGLNSRVTGTCISTDTELEHGCQNWWRLQALQSLITVATAPCVMYVYPETRVRQFRYIGYREIWWRGPAIGLGITVW